MRKALALTSAAGVALAAATRRAHAGVFDILGTAATELSANLPIILGVTAFALGGFLVLLAPFLYWKHYKYGHRGDGMIGQAAAAFVAGCVVLGVVAFATEGTMTFTGGAPSAGTGGGLTW